MNLFNNNNTNKNPKSQAHTLFPTSNIQNKKPEESNNTQNVLQKSNDENEDKNKDNGIKDVSSTNLGQGLPQRQNVEQREVIVSFVEIYRKIKMNQKATILELQHQHYKSIFLLNLQYFNKTSGKTEEYKRKYEQKNNFGFGKAELGGLDIRSTNKEIDNFWKELVNNFSNIVGINEIVTYEYLRKYIQVNEIYNKKLLKNVSNRNLVVLRPDIDFIKNLYIGNGQNNENLIVDTKSQLYKQIFNGLFFMYEEQIISLLQILIFMSKGQNCQKYLMDLIRMDLIKILWHKFKQFSLTQTKTLFIKDEIRQAFRDNYKQNFEKNFQKHRFQVIKRVCELMTHLVKNKYDQKLKLNSTKQIRCQVVSFIDKDIMELEIGEQGYLEKEEEFIHIQRELKLILATLSFQNLQKQLKNSQIQKVIKKTQSRHLQTIRMLVDMMVPVNNLNRNRKLEQYWQNVPQSLDWMMLSTSWKQWLMVFLQFKTADEILQFDILGSLVMSLCKNIFKENPDFLKQENKESRGINKFLREGFDKKGIKHFFSILTKCLGSTIQSVVETIHLIGEQSLRNNTILKICNNLQLSDKQNLSKLASIYISQRSMSSPVNKMQGTPEQQLKFICRMVCICANDLPFLEEKLFGTVPNEGTGIEISLFLVNCLQKLHEFSISNLKCMRYIVVALDKLFVNKASRKSLLMSLCLAWRQELGRNTTQIPQMVTFCLMKEKMSEEERQGRKLREVLSIHLNNLIRFSTHINQYFPMSCDPQQAQPPLQIIQCLSENKSKVYNWFMETSQSPQYRNSPWFYDLLFLLQGDNLLPHDFDSIRLLLQNGLIKQSTNRQYENMRVVYSYLNQCKIIKIIKDTLQPILFLEEWMQVKRRPLFGVVNKKYFTLQIGQYEAFYNTNRFNKKHIKMIKFMQRQEMNILGNVAGCLQLINTMLRIAKQTKQYDKDKSSLVQRLTFFDQVVDMLTNHQKIYHYDCDVYKKKKQGKQRMKYESIKTKTKIPINILQVIGSCINMQEMLFKKNKEHKNRRQQYESQFMLMDEIDYMGLQQIKIDEEIQFQLYENKLKRADNQLSYLNECSIGIGGVLKVYMQLLTMDKSKILIQCIFNSNLQLRQTVPLSYFQLTMVESLYREIMEELLYNRFLSSQEKQIIYQFMALSINKSESITYYLVRNKENTKLLKEAIMRDIINIKYYNVFLLNRIAMLVAALCDRRKSFPSQIDSLIKYPQNIIYEIIKKLTYNKDKHKYIKLNYEGRSTYNRLAAFKEVNREVLCMSTFNLCLQMIKGYVLVQSKQILSSMITYVIGMTKSIFKEIPTIQELQLLTTLKLHPHHCLNINKNEQMHYLVHNGLSSILQPLYSHCINSYGYGRDYQYSCRIAFNKLLILKNKQNIMTQINKIQTTNILYSLYHCQQSTISNLLCLYQVIVSIGEYGHIMSNIVEENILIKGKWNKLQQSHIVKQMKGYYKDVSENKLSKLQIMGISHNQAYQNIMNIVRILVQYLQYNTNVDDRNRKLFNNHSNDNTLDVLNVNYNNNINNSRINNSNTIINRNKQYNNDSILLTISQMIKTIVGYFKIHGQNMSRLNSFKELLNYLLACTSMRFDISLKVYLYFLQACLQGYHMNVKVYNQQSIKYICERIQIIFFKPYSTFTHSTIQENIFYICTIFGNIIHNHNPNHYHHNNNSLHYYSATHKQIMQIVSVLCGKFVNEHLKLQFDVKTLCIITLVNQIINNTSNNHNHNNHNHKPQFINSYVRYLCNTHSQDPVYNYYVLESLAMVHDKYSEVVGNMFQFVRRRMPLSIGHDLQKTQEKTSKKKIEKYRFTQVFDSDELQREFSLVLITQMKGTLMFLCVLTQRKQHWVHRSHSQIMQAIFMMLIEQTSITDLMHIILTGRVSSIGDPQKYLMSVTLPPSEYSHQNGQRKQHYYYYRNLFQFVVQTQTCYIIHFYLQSLCNCMGNSQHLTNFYSKIINSSNNQLTQMSFQKMEKTITKIIQYLTYVVEALQNNTHHLHTFLTMFNYISSNTDFGYDTDFINASLFPNISNTQQYYHFIMSTLSMCFQSVLVLVGVWSRNDWKSQINWAYIREQLLKKCQCMVERFNRLMTKDKAKKHVFEEIKQMRIILQQRIRKEEEAIKF